MSDSRSKRRRHAANDDGSGQEQGGSEEEAYDDEEEGHLRKSSRSSSSSSAKRHRSYGPGENEVQGSDSDDAAEEGLTQPFGDNNDEGEEDEDEEDEEDSDDDSMSDSGTDFMNTGKIKQIECEDFMRHRHLTVDLNKSVRASCFIFNWLKYLTPTH